MKIITLGIMMMASICAFGQNINIKNIGAIADGKTDNTKIIQSAIDKCSANRSTLIVPGGVFLIGPLFLKSNVHIHLEAGAVLLGNTDLAIYHRAFTETKGKRPPALIFGENIENVSISGTGKIDGQGAHLNFQLGDDSETGIIRPIILYLKGVKKVNVTDVSLHNSAYWVQKYEDCDGVLIRGIRVYSHSNFNNDGLDLNGSKNVIVSDCLIDTDDDALCFKSEVDKYAVCENITVTNCVLRSNCNGLKFGTGSMSGFKNVTISNCVIYQASEDNRRYWKKKMPWMGITLDRTVIAGIALECVDGGVMDQISISNIVMRDVQTPIFIRLGDRKRVFSDKISVLKNVNISNVIATTASQLVSSITGVPGAQVENIAISNVQIFSPGGQVDLNLTKKVPEVINGYPENRMFGNVLPASGFYIRHAKNITFDNINFHTQDPDNRPPFVMEDVSFAEFYRCKMNNVLIVK